MAKAKKAVVKFRPERPIYLGLENTRFKTEEELIIGIEALRAAGWLVTLLPEGARHRPFHLSFADDNAYQEFKVDCQDLGIELRNKLISEDDFDTQIDAAPEVEGANEHDTVETTDGKVAKNTDKPSKVSKL